MSTRFPVYTRANAGETLPEPASPLGWTLVFEHGLLGWRRAFVDIGVYRDGEITQVGGDLAGLFGSYFFVNLSHMRVVSLRMGQPVEQTDLGFVGSRPDIPAYQPHPDDIDDGASAKAAAWVQSALVATEFPDADRDRERLLDRRRQRPDLVSLSDRDLVAYSRAGLDEVETTFYRHVMSSLPATFGPGMLAPLCEKAGRGEDFLDLIGGIGGVHSAGSADRLWDLSRRVAESTKLGALFDDGAGAVMAAIDTAEGELREFRVAFETFLAAYGDRGANEWDIRGQTWEDNQLQPLALIDTLRHSPDSEAPARRHIELAQRRARAAARVRLRLADDIGALAAFDTGMRVIDVWMPARETTKANCVAALHEIRVAIKELGERGVTAGRFERPEDVMMLVAGELDAYVADPDGISHVISDRLAEAAVLATLEPPFFLSSEARIDTWPRAGSTTGTALPEGGQLIGVGGSAGTVTGLVRVVNDLAECAELEPGEILVAPFTDPGWTPLFLVADGAVIDVGGMNSHAVVVCRELGIPAVISVGDGTRRLRNGMRITVDGAAGTVTVVKSAPL